MSELVKWEDVGTLWRGLATQPLNRPDSTLQWLLEEIKILTNAEQATCALSARSAPHSEKDPDHLLGWRKIAWIPCESNPYKDMSFAKSWMEDKSNTVGNECVIGLFRHAGTHRAMLMDDIAPGATLEDVKKDGLYRFYGVVDRMFAVYALEPGLEVYFYVDRGTEPKFDAYERDHLKAVLPGLGPVCTRLAMSYGALESQTRLTPRERETLLYLLEGLSEKEIANEMGLTVRSAHQNVVSVYRKLNISSRAGLMATWMNPAMELANNDTQPHISRPLV